MELKDFEFDLPEGLIAQRPLKERDASRLMVLKRSSGEFSHATFREIKGYLKKGDVLILNDTKVIPARLYGAKATGGSMEVLLVEKKQEANSWACMIGNSKGLKKGSLLFFDRGVEAEIIDKGAGGFWTIRFKGPFEMDEIGNIPLPPYIRREAGEEDRVRYQTVFAGHEGAVAAPTAGLHFTEGLIDELKNGGVEVNFITLHTGPGTFMPVRVADVTKHRMMSERYSISPEVFESVRKAKEEGQRVIAVGTTATRALEASVAKGFDDPCLEGATELFIYPGFSFKAIDALLTNFHLPGSTLIMLVAAFAGRENTLNAYREAVREGYRFFSYGDAMLIV